ncbi:MAG: hypothetical protein JRJ25_00505 [Deltaproteobacteria bacterium]|nr:hypothetical protein [Deltaproteobacteria bacterium]
MILPHPETDFSLNILVVAADIIKELKRHRKTVLLEKIMQSFLNKDLKRTPDLFIKSLVFLYSFGLIEYDNYKVKLTPRTREQQINLFE